MSMQKNLSILGSVRPEPEMRSQPMAEPIAVIKMKIAEGRAPIGFAPFFTRVFKLASVGQLARRLFTFAHPHRRTLSRHVQNLNPKSGETPHD